MSDPITLREIADYLQDHESRLRSVEKEVEDLMAANRASQRGQFARVNAYMATVRPPAPAAPATARVSLEEAAPAIPEVVEPAPAEEATAPAEQPVVDQPAEAHAPVAIVLPEEPAAQSAEVPATTVSIQDPEPPRAPEPTPAKPTTDFLTEEEMFPPKPRRQAREWEEAKVEAPVSLEERIGTTWLLRVGGVLIMIGAAWGAVRLESNMAPAIRVLGGFLLAAAIGIVGQFIRRRHELVGRAGIAIGLALGYFLSYASHHIGRMECLPMALSLGGMFLFAGALVVLAERWRSEMLAGFGLGLALIPSLLSASHAPQFSIIAILGLGLASGVMLLRNGWMKLTAISMLAVYAAMAVVASLDAHASRHGGPHSLASYLVAAMVQHLVFVAAFLRWSRAWIAREKAIDRIDNEAVPSGFIPGQMPWGRGFDILNTLGLVALTFYVAVIESRIGGSGFPNSLWNKLHWALLPIAGIELLRLLVRRDDQLAVFHSLTAVGLLTTAAVWGLEGPSEALALAVCTLTFTVAGSQSWQLRWLRAASAVPASMTMLGITRSLFGGTFEVGTLIAPIVLLLSALPYETWLARGRWQTQSTMLRTLSMVAGHYRGLIASAAFIGIMMKHMNGETLKTMAPLALAVAMVAGMRFLRANAWLAGAVFATVLGLLLPFVRPIGDGHFLIAAFGILAAGVAWNLLWSRGDSAGVVATHRVMAFGSLAALLWWHLSGLMSEGNGWIELIVMPLLALFSLHPMLHGLFAARRQDETHEFTPQAFVATLLIGMVMLPLLLRAPSMMHATVGAMALSVLAMVPRRATTWRFGIYSALGAALLSTLASYAAPSLLGDLRPHLISANWPGVVLSTIAIVAVFDKVLKRLGRKPEEHLGALLAIPAVLAYLVITHNEGGHWQSLMLLAFAGITGLIYLALGKLDLVPPRRQISASTVTSLLGAGISAGAALLMDCPTNIVPALLISVVGLGSWAWLAMFDLRREKHALLPLFVVALSMGIMAFFIRFDFQSSTLLQAALYIAGAFVITRLLSREHEQVCVAVLGAALCAVSSVYFMAKPSIGGAWIGLGMMAMAIWMSRSFRAEALRPLGLAVLYAGILLGVVSLAAGLPAVITTASWGVLAMALLVGGFVLREAAWRHAAIGIFALSILRLLVIDMAESNMNARILASIGVGALMVAAAYLYAFLSKNLLREPGAKEATDKARI